MSDLTLWDDKSKLETIKSMYASNLSVMEFQTFLEIGRRTQLNPFLREIWAVKYKGPAQIFIGRDGYRRLIGRNPNYEYHTTDAVYENDEFECDLANGKVTHRYSLKNRGKLVGAYCLVKMKSSTIPFYVFAEFGEYNLGQSLWVSKPATMIKKVAESQAIRMAIPSELNGTYTPEEFGNVIEQVEEPTVTHQEVLQLVKAANISDEVIQSWFEKANITSFEEFTQDQLIKIKNKLKGK